MAQVLCSQISLVGSSLPPRQALGQAPVAMADNDSDIYATDKEEGPSSSSAVRADNRKRPATARISAVGAGPLRAKRAKHATVVGPTAAPAPAPSNWAQVKCIGGECAPFNDKSAYVDDPINHRTFLIGGIRPNDEKNNPSSDFYCCDTVSMQWKNLTVSSIPPVCWPLA